MAGSVVNIEFLFDQRSHTLGFPEISFPAMCLGPVFEQLDELLSVLFVKLWIRALVALISGALQSPYSLIYQC